MTGLVLGAFDGKAVAVSGEHQWVGCSVWSGPPAARSLMPLCSVPARPGPASPSWPRPRG